MISYKLLYDKDGGVKCVDRLTIVRLRWWRRLLCFHLWVIPVPMDNDFMCVKCGQTEYLYTEGG